LPKPAAAPAQKEPKPQAERNNTDTAIDLAALQNLRANGSLRIGSLKVKNIRAANVRIDLRAADGKLHLQPLAADLYGGSVNGEIAITAAKPARFAVRQTLANVNIGPLLQDAIGSAPITGRGNVAFNVNAVGGTVSQVKKALDGTARLQLRDGVVQGINIAQAIRNAKARVGQTKGGEQGGTGSTTEKTDFSELTASFKIANGVARNNDLKLKSPLIRVGGAGAIDLGNDRIDYTVRATVVPTLQGQGGAELQSLKGLTIPVQLEGPFTAIGWRIDFAGLVRGLAAKRVEEQSEDVRSKLQEQFQKGLKGLLDK
jgi:AsmA protein